MKTNLSSRFGILLILVLVGSLLAACSGASGTPVATQPAATSAAPALLATSTSQPTALATATLLPTATDTPAPTAIATLVPTAIDTPAPTATQPPAPTATAVRPALAADVLRVWTYSGATMFIANQGFSLAIYLKNTGTVAWQPGYQLKFTGLTNGGDITVQPEEDLTTTVPPGGKVEFDLWAFGSETLGDHTWYFALFTANGKKVPGSECSFTFTMIHN